MRYTVLLSPQPDATQGYAVVAPSIPGCFTQGDTRAEALANAVEVIELCLEVMADRGEPMPKDDPALVAQGVFEVLQDREDLGWPPALEITSVEVLSSVAASV